jgi:hypothetical protein
MVICDSYYSDMHCRQSLWILKTNSNYAYLKLFLKQKQLDDLIEDANLWELF